MFTVARLWAFGGDVAGRVGQVLLGLVRGGLKVLKKKWVKVKIKKKKKYEKKACGLLV